MTWWFHSLLLLVSAALALDLIGRIKWPVWAKLLCTVLTVITLCALIVPSIITEYQQSHAETVNKFDVSSKVPSQSEIDKGFASMPISFREMFDRDFQMYIASGVELTVTLVDQRQFTVPTRMMMDFSSRTKFLAFFISPNYDGQTVSHIMLNDIDNIVNRTSFGAIVTSSFPGDSSSVSSTKLVFTNLVYIYNEIDMSISQQAEVEQAYSDKGISVQFRGLAYYALHEHDIAFKRLPTSPPRKKALATGLPDAPLSTPTPPAPPAGK